MQAIDTLKQLIEQQQGRLAEGIPPNRGVALQALLRLIDRFHGGSDAPIVPDLVTGRDLPELGAMLALRLVLKRDDDRSLPIPDAGDWAEGFLSRCRDVESARIVLHLVEAGEMRLDSAAPGEFDAWIIGGRAPAMWRERASIDAWEHRRRGAGPKTGGLDGDTTNALVTRMAYQLSSPVGASLGGVPTFAYLDVLAGLIELCAGPARQSAAEVSEWQELVVAVARVRGLDVALASGALSAMVLDRDSVGWHAETLAGPLPPLVRFDGGRVAWSRLGMLTQPLFFAGRELRRRDADSYHSAARLRETVFRDDLAGLFIGSRYVWSRAPIMLRTRDRRNRTDIDAALFDRKTGTLSLFELKSQDPFARSAAERARQQDAMRQAGAQMAAVLGWIDGEGADEVLSRLDESTAKRFKVHRVLPFVLGRFLADGGGDGRRDRRIAWGVWPDVMRIMEEATSGNPLLSLHTALGRQSRASLEPWEHLPSAEIQLGEATLWVHGTAARAKRRRRGHE